MDCKFAKELLSHYADGELTAQDRATVKHHLDACPDCTRELQDFQELSQVAADLPHPEAPQLWTLISGELHSESPSQRACGQAFSNWLVLRWPILVPSLGAATVLLVLSMWAIFGERHSGTHQLTAKVLERYVTEFSRAPETAQETLLENFHVTPLDPTRIDKLVRRIGFRPTATSSLPRDYIVKSAYVVEMPCCTCVQFICEDTGGASIAIFEHAHEHPEWFGDRSRGSTECAGRSCQLIALDSRFAATWSSGTRHITAIGLGRRDDLEELVASTERDFEQYE